MWGCLPGERRGGRAKGVQNRSTVLAKEAIELAARKLGGPKRLSQWAKESPENEKAFWIHIYTKLLPLQVTGPNNGPLQIAVSDENRAAALMALLARTRPELAPPKVINGTAEDVTHAENLKEIKGSEQGSDSDAGVLSWDAAQRVVQGPGGDEAEPGEGYSDERGEASEP
jgi:hypothetical protein